MKNQEIANIFYEIADILEIQGVDWKPNAYRKAARVLESLSKDVEELYKEKGINGLLEISGIGKGLAKKIVQYLAQGRINEFEKLKKSLPQGLEELMHVRGLGPKKIHKLYKILKIKNLKDLENSAKKGKIRSLEGFGEKSEKEILSSIQTLKTSKERTLLGRALPIARFIENNLRNLESVEKVQVSGSVRRMKETVKDIDFLVVSKKPLEVMNFFTTMQNVSKILAKGQTKSSVLLKEGLNADVRVIQEKSFGAALQYFTGNKDHNVRLRQIAIKKGWKLNEYGLFDKKGSYLAGRTEEEVYKKLDLQYFEPELRENTGELETKKLPKLIQYNSLKGDLHVHTKWSDGNNTTEEMVKEAIKLGYECIAITDHSKSQKIANGLEEKRLLKHLKEIDLLQKKYPQIKIFKGSEVDILADGRLDYSNKILEQLDIVVASVHSGFKTSKEEMTKRILKAIDSGFVTILGHPTGRLINERNPYDVDMEKIFEKCKEKSVVLEINSSPERLDLKDNHIKQALSYGLKFCINTDSHSTTHMKFSELGIAQARRGWLESKDVVNTLSLKDFEKAIKK